MSGLLAPEINEEIIGTAEVLDIFKVSKVGKVAGSKVLMEKLIKTLMQELYEMVR